MNNLNDVFNIAPVANVTPPPEDKLVVDDFELARTAIRNMIVKGESTLDDLVELAKQSEHPRSYEVASQMMSSISTMAKDLLDLQKTNKQLTAPTKEQAAIGTQNNILFAGSTQDLLSMISKQGEKVVSSTEN